MNQPLHILIVEDSEADAILLQHTLKRGGYEVVCEVVDSAVSMRAALEKRKNWDVITSDHVMPQFNAPAALALSAELCPDVPFIIVSGEIDLNLAVSLMRGGAKDYIQKRDLALLVPAIERELREVQLRRERQQVSTALNEREAHYRLLFQSMDSGFALCELIFDTQGVPYDYRFLEVNPAFEKLTGYRAEELIGHTMLEVLPGTEKERIERYGKVAMGGEVLHVENYNAELGKYFEVTAYSPQPGEFAVIFHDITERKQVESALLENQLFIQRIADTIPNQLYVFDLVSGQNIYINQKTKDFFGLTLKEIQARGQSLFFDLIHPDDLSALTEFVTQWELAEDNQVFEKEYRLRNAAGEYRWLRSYESILRRDSSGVPTQIVGMAADITEQKRAEEALRESRLFIEKIINTIPVRIFWKDTHHVYQGCNAAFARDAGFADPQDLIGKDDYQLWLGLAEMYRDDDRQVIESGVARLLIEEPLMTAEGNSRLVQTSKVPLRNSSDQIVGVLGMYLDITERKVAEEALRKSEELMRYIVKYDPNSIAVFDRNMHYLAVSDRYLRDYGVKEEDILGKHHYQVFPEMPQKWKDVHERCLAGAIERNDNDYFERLDGSITYNRWECRPWHQVDGSIGGIVLYSEVTTERKLMEEALRENRAILQAAMDNSPAGIAIADAPDGKLRYVNDAGLMIRGGDRQQIVEGIGIDQYVASWQLMDLDGRPLKPDEVPLARAILFGETNSREFIVRRESDDDRIVLANAAPILDEDAKVKAAIVVFSDITENKQAEAKIRKLNTELEARVADRTAQLITANQELEAFSYSVSHDLRAPLRSIEGFSAILLEEYAESLDEVGKHYLARIKDGSERMGQLINDMLHLSQVTTLSEFHRERVNLSDLAAQIAAELSAESPQRKVEFDIAADLIVSGDENLLKIVLENLLNNALKFTVRRETAIIQVGMIEHDGKPTYFVRDNGAGFDMAYASRLFAPFQRLHSSQEFPGTGIGLATVQRIIHRHGGRVWAEGAVDNGATFYFTVA